MTIRCGATKKSMNGSHIGRHLGNYLYIYEMFKYELRLFRNIYFDKKFDGFMKWKLRQRDKYEFAVIFGRHLEYLNFPKGDKVASIGFGFSTLELSKIDHKTLYVLQNTLLMLAAGLPPVLSQTLYMPYKRYLLSCYKIAKTY